MADAVMGAALVRNTAAEPVQNPPWPASKARRGRSAAWRQATTLISGPAVCKHEASHLTQKAIVWNRYAADSAANPLLRSIRVE